MGNDAILQVRADRELSENETGSILNIIEKYIDSTGYEFLDAEKGIDVYIPGVKTARHIASRIMKVLGGSQKESTKYLRVENGRVIYRFTIRIKLPEEPSKGSYGLPC